MAELLIPNQWEQDAIHEVHRALVDLDRIVAGLPCYPGFVVRLCVASYDAWVAGEALNPYLPGTVLPEAFDESTMPSPRPTRVVGETNGEQVF